MVKCRDCGREMMSARGCNCGKIVINGQLYQRDTKYSDVNKRCHDCGRINKPRYFHHFGCDIERCPRCKRQLIACNCKKQYVLCGKKFKKA